MDKKTRKALRKLLKEIANTNRYKTISFINLFIKLIHIFSN